MDLVGGWPRERSYDNKGEGGQDNNTVHSSETTMAIPEVSPKAAPYWLPGKRPESVDAVVGDTAVFYCEAAGRPSVEYQWFLNGVRIEKLLRTDRRVQEKNKLTFLNVSKDDAMVIQCGASNKHSHINASAYLSVLTEPPLIQIPPEVGQSADEGQNVNLTCTVFESPKPIVIWHKGHKQLTGGRYKIMDHGDLQIMNVSSADAGTYTCTAQNKVGVTSATGSLVVRRK
ncbi:Contactin-3 [Lamellibrachia satsuma]|nr:Contactin-3 [Lamellibrachia satsuma]